MLYYPYIGAGVGVAVVHPLSRPQTVKAFPDRGSTGQTHLTSDLAAVVGCKADCFWKDSVIHDAGCCTISPTGRQRCQIDSKPLHTSGVAAVLVKRNLPGQGLRYFGLPLLLPPAKLACALQRAKDRTSPWQDKDTCVDSFGASWS